MPIVGDVLADRYRLDARLGAGGMATVWQAHDLRLERDVAIKMLAANLAGDPVVAQRFEREARSLAASSHPNVVAIYDVEQGDRTAGREPFYVMELCDGGSLADRLAAEPERRLAPDEGVPILVAVADGLASLHDRGLIHRDVKPHNVLLCGGRPKLADFGLARSEAADELADLTGTGMTVGTLAYLAPEVLDGAPATTASDVYGLGVVAFQVLTGRMPRASGSVAEVVAARDAPAPRLSELAPRLGRAFDEPVGRALARDPATRPAAREFASAVRRALLGVAAITARDDADASTQAIPTPRPAAVAATTGASRARSRRSLAPLGWGALVVLALLVLAAMAAALGDQGGRPPVSRGATSIAPVSPSPSIPASPSPSVVSPSPTPSPKPSSPPPATQDPLEPVRSAQAELLDVLEVARENGLGRGEANQIERLAEDALRELERGNADAARGRAQDLLDRLDNLDDEVDDDVAEALQAAGQQFAQAVHEATGG